MSSTEYFVLFITERRWKFVNFKLSYVWLQGYMPIIFYYSVEFYETTTFTEFVYLEISKIDIPDESKVSLSYQYPDELFYCVMLMIMILES